MSEKKRWKKLQFLSCAIPILLLVYVLSVGPACALSEDPHGVIPPGRDSVLRAIYAPLVWAIENNSTCAELFYQYYQLCSPNH